MWIEFAGHDAEARGLGSRRGRDELLQLDAGRSEAAVESDHHGAGAFRERVVDGREFLAGKAERLLDEYVAIGFERLLHQQRVQMMPGGNHHGGGARVE